MHNQVIGTSNADPLNLDRRFQMITVLLACIITGYVMSRPIVRVIRRKS